ncbi:hypothetical protein [Sorangium sp. So ce204]|uniref:hypothetical protein n=1 Tax=Sorangium sp. So ce204 TaxID=3133288 RepID=UPI003F5FF7D9
MTTKHEIGWVTAAPLWRGRAVAPGVIAAPDLLRFDSDDFMDDLTALLAKRPADLAGKIATKKTYRARPPGAPGDWPPTPAALRLYQPVHGHFNLVIASLVCHTPGLPDHGVDPAKGEEAWFVLRRLRKSDAREMAWVTDAQKRHTWSPIAGDAKLGEVAEGEQLLPLFMVPFTENGRTRRLWAGLIPTSSRETFVATREAVPEVFPEEAAPAPGAPHPGVPEPPFTDPELVEARARVIGGLQALVTPRTLLAQTPAERHAEERMEQEVTRFFLLDLADLLTRYAPSVMGASRPPSTAPKARALYDLLPATGVRDKLAQALSQWAEITGEGEGTSSITVNLRNVALDVYTFARALDEAIKEHLAATPAPAPAGGDPARPGAMELPQLDDGEARYVLRCVYRRTRCRPPHPDLVSARSAEFTIAPFFDPDAPARAVRIALPVDTSLKGLRKFRKGVAFLLSDQLRKQMSQASNMKDLLDGKAGSEEPFTLGEICSFSIPIITLCAFIVLMIFMILLNFVFWWLPLLRFCFPIIKRK